MANLDIAVGRPAPTTGHIVWDPVIPCDHDVVRVTIVLRQIGWIDQRGEIYPLAARVGPDFKGGSLTPLLINPGCD